MRWVLLLRAVNLGPTNKLAMKDLQRVLEDLGHDEVKTYLNSGNATFTSDSSSATDVAGGVERALSQQLGLEVRACVRSEAQVKKVLDELPDLPGYVTCTVLFDRPKAANLEAFLGTDWSPETVQGNDQVVYTGFQNAARTKLTLARLERALGVSATARTPATLAKLVT